MSRDSESNLAAMLTWCCVALAALLLAACRVPLWARPARQPEGYALPLMVAALAGAASLLFPWLMRRLRSAVFVALSAAIFVQLAGLLNDSAQRDTAQAGAAVVIWLVSLGMWRYALRSYRWQLVGVATAGAVAIGGLCAVYMVHDFRSIEMTPAPRFWLLLGLIFTGALAAAMHAYLHVATASPQDLHNNT